MRILLVTFAVFLFSGLSAQDLSLKEAVLEQYGKYSTYKRMSLNWVPGTNKIYHFSDDGKSIQIQNIGDKGSKDWVLLSDVNKAVNGELFHIAQTEVQDEKSLLINTGQGYLIYDIASKTAKKSCDYPVKADNITYHKGKVAYTIANNLYLSDGKDKKINITQHPPGIVAGQAIARSEFGITNGIFWSPSGNKLAFYEKDERNVGDYPLLDISTTPGSLNSVKYPMAGQTSERAKVGIYDLETKKTIYLKVKGDPEQYLTNFAWGPNEALVYVAVVNRDQNHMWLNTYNAETGDFVKTLFEEENERYVEPENPPYFIGAGKNQSFLWLSERDGYMHVYHYNMDGTLKKQLTSGKFVVLEILGLDAKGRTLTVLTTDESGMNTVVRSVSMKGGSVMNISKTPGQHSAHLSEDGKYIIDNYSSLTIPRNIEVLDSKGKKVQLLYQNDNPFEEGQLGTTEFIELKTKNGTLLNARMIKPHDFDSTKQYPVLVYVYGGPHAQMVKNQWLGGASLWMHHFANKGYIVFTLDNRGSANRGFEFESVIHRQLGTIEMRDQLVGVNYLKSLPYVNKEKMAVHGWSFGGFMTTSMMLRQPGTFKVGVAGGPVTDWKYYEIMYGERYMDRPEENKEGYADAALMNHVKNLEGDLLLIHGGIDDVVVPQHSFALIRAFVENEKQVDFFTYPTHPHNVRGKDRVHLMDKVLRYVEDKLED